MHKGLPLKWLCFDGFRVTGWLLAVSLMSLIPHRSAAVSKDRVPLAPHLPCYAFLRNGDLWTVCNGARKKIDLKHKALDFALSSDGKYFVAVEQQAYVKGSGREPEGELLIVSLQDKPKAETRKWAFDLPLGRLHASCGTVITISRDPGLEGRLGLVHDVLSGRPVETPYKSSHCSADKGLIAGWKDAERPELYVSSHPETPLKAERWQDFDVSPSGRYISYFARPNASAVEICVSDDQQHPFCTKVDEPTDLLGRISVSDSGQAIYQSSGTAHCYFRDEEHYATERTSRTATEDPCPAVVYWERGRDKPEILETLGDHPQWIASEAAAALSRWNELNLK